jgi:hypothetical protein
LQFDDLGRELQTGFENRDRLVEPSGFCQLAGMFPESRRERRPPRRGLAQSVKRLVAAPCGGKCRGKQGFDGRITAAARRPLQRRDRLAGAVLHHQRSTENRRRDNVTPVGLQDIGGDPLSLIRPLHL